MLVPTSYQTLSIVLSLASQPNFPLSDGPLALLEAILRPPGRRDPPLDTAERRYGGRQHNDAGTQNVLYDEERSVGHLEMKRAIPELSQERSKDIESQRDL